MSDDSDSSSDDGGFEVQEIGDNQTPIVHEQKIPSNNSSPSKTKQTTEAESHPVYEITDTQSLVHCVFGDTCNDIDSIQAQLVKLKRLQTELINGLESGLFLGEKLNEEMLLKLEKIPLYLAKLEKFPLRKQQIEERLNKVKLRLRESSQGQ